MDRDKRMPSSHPDREPVPHVDGLPPGPDLSYDSESHSSDDECLPPDVDSEQERDILERLAPGMQEEDIQEMVNDYYLRSNVRKRKKEQKLARKHGRQGRSHQSREREVQVKMQYGHIYQNYGNWCQDCKNNSNFLEDAHSGDVICAECGAVASEKGLGFQEYILPTKRRSKPYHPLVHFRQRLAQLTGKDPKIRAPVFRRIRHYLRNIFDPKLLYTFGKRNLSRILTLLGLPRRYSANWIQVRRRLNLDPEPPICTNEDLLWRRMNMRYLCLTVAFIETLSKKEGRTIDLKRAKNLGRKNIINVNYSYLQLLRLEEPSLLDAFGKFLPQLCSKEQPNKNNKRWKILMEYCHAHFPRSVCAKTGETFSFNWEYVPLTQRDIEEHCVYFD